MRKGLSQLLTFQNKKLPLHISFTKALLLILISLFSTNLYAAGEEYLLKVEFFPTLSHKRYHLSDQVNTNSIVSSKLSYGFGVNFYWRVFSKESFFNIGFSQDTVRLGEPSNASLSQDEISYLHSHFLYEYHGHFFMFRIGGQYDKEYYLYINNNIIRPESLQNTYYTIGLFSRSKVGYKSRVFIGFDFAQLASASDINGKELQNAYSIKYGTKFNINYRFLSLIFELYYQSSFMKYEGIEQNTPETGLNLGIKF